MSELAVTAVGLPSRDLVQANAPEGEMRARIVSALRARRSGLVTALAPLLDQQASVLEQELGLDRAMVDRVVQEQRALLDVLARRYDALDEAVVCSEIPFAEINGDGWIVYANRALEELVSSPEGRKFTSLFGARGPHVEEALESGGNTSLRVDVQAEGERRQVRLEVGPLRDETDRPGSYALLLDQSAERSRLNALQDGVFRTDLDGRICFVNERAAECLGCDGAELLSTALGSVMLPETDDDPDPIPRWQATESGFSEFIRLRLKDGRTMPARVSGMPYIEGSNRSAGLLVLFAPLVEDLARQELKRILLDEPVPLRIIEAALTAIGTVIPFDMALFGIYDEQCSFWRALAITPKPDWEWTTRWFPITAETKIWLEKGLTWDNSIDKWVERYNPNADHDPVARAVLKRKFKSMLLLPIREVGGFRSAVTLLSKDRPYGAADLRTLQNLGVEEVLQAADAALERKRAQAVRTLKDELNQAQTGRNLAERLAKGAIRIFEWGYVGVFRVDREKQRFVLVEEDATDPTLLVQPPNSQKPYEQELHLGMLGLSLQRKSILVVNDVDDATSNYGFIRTAPGQRSALTIPLFVNGKIEMILDLESTELNAFLGPDQDAARGLAADCEQIFAARWHQVIERALMNRIDQAAVIVDASGAISELNSAAETMLGKAQGSSLASYGVRDEDRALLRQSGRDLLPRAHVTLSVSTGTGLPPAEVATLAERTPLFDDYGHQLWLFTSLAEQSRASDWGYLEQTVTAVAQQTRAPLLIANGLLRGAASLARRPELMERCARMLEQAAVHLLKADLTFERLSDRLTVQQPPSDAPTRFDARQVLYHELDALPEADQNIEVSDEFERRTALSVLGWPERLAFAFRSAIGSLLLQRVTPEDRLSAAILKEGPDRFRVRIFVSGCRTEELTSNATDPIKQSQLRARSLTRSAVDAIATAVEQHGGTLTERDGIFFEFTLPLNAMENLH